MFEAAIDKFVKTVGKESLVAVPSLDEASKCQLFQAVVLKRRKWFWQSPKYEVTPLLLQDLLVDEENKFVSPISSHPLATYNKTYQFSLSGKLGGALSSLFEGEVDGSDSVSIEAKFGEITKDEVDRHAFMEEIVKRQLDLKHQLIEQVIKDSRKVLCVIVGVAKIASDASIHMNHNISGEEKEDAKLSDSNTENEDISGKDVTDKTLGLKKGTALAYNLCQLDVGGSGALTLLLEKDSKGGFSLDKVDAAEADKDDDLELSEQLTLENQFGALTESVDAVKKGELIEAVLTVCTKPADISLLLTLMKNAWCAACASPPGTGSVEKVNNKHAAKTVLKLCGFMEKDENTVTFPEQTGTVFSAITTLFQALDEMSDDALSALTKLDGSHTSSLIYLLSESLDLDGVPVHDDHVKAIYDEPNTSQDFLTSLGFKVDGSELVAADDNIHELEGAYRVVYALWWHPDLHDDIKKPTWRCAIL